MSLGVASDVDGFRNFSHSVAKKDRDGWPQTHSSRARESRAQLRRR